jgi:hypothetical protein
MIAKAAGAAVILKYIPFLFPLLSAGKVLPVSFCLPGANG